MKSQGGLFIDMVTVVLEKADGFFWCHLRGHRTISEADLIIAWE